MNIRQIMTKRFCLSLAAALAVTSVLVTQHAGVAANPEGEGIVYVYFPSLCAAPGDARDCREIAQTHRPSFESMAACWVHADAELARAGDPRLLASCLKQREG